MPPKQSSCVKSVDCFLCAVNFPLLLELLFFFSLLIEKKLIDIFQMSNILIRSLNPLRRVLSSNGISTRTYSVLYTARCTSVGGRDGQVTSDDNSKRLNLKLAQPKEMGGTDASGTNPEELFAAGYSSCFLAAMGLAAKNMRKSIPVTASVNAVVHLGEHKDGNFGFQVELTANIPGANQDDADGIVRAAHKICPFSRKRRFGRSLPI